MDSVILARDASRLFLLKPPGVPVFPPHRDPSGDCLLRRLLAEGEGEGEWPEGFAGGIAHRLDNATAGLVVAARDIPALLALRGEFASGALRKMYRFHTGAMVAWTDRVVTDEIAHHQRRKEKMVIRNGPRSTHRGRWYPAWTRFTAMGGPWWRAEIRTGVMHQIRVHAAAHGLPLTGDLLYGGAPGPFVLVHERVLAPGWVSPGIPESLLSEWMGARVILRE